jgi:hypothetical protein
MEKRANRRHAIDTAIVCSHLTTVGSSKAVDGRMRNCCINGMHAELQAGFRAGTILVVRAMGSSRGYSRDEGFRSLALAEVKWSLPRFVEGHVCYATGLKYVMV